MKKHSAAISCASTVITVLWVGLAPASDVRDDSVPGDAIPCVTRQVMGKKTPPALLRPARQLSYRQGSFDFSNVQTFACDLRLTVR